MGIITGNCHCGNISYELTTKIDPSDIKARACDCRFCRVHGAQNWSDPDGTLRWRIRDQAQLHQYRFALKTADFYICRVCGAYAGAVLEEEGKAWSTVNLRLAGLELDETVMSFGGEDTAGRVARRKQVWTPTGFPILAGGTP